MEPKKSKQEQLLLLTKNIQFNNMDVPFSLKNKTLIRKWIAKAILLEKKTPDFISYNFCSDKTLLRFNKKYLNHNDYTDIITFDFCDGDMLSGDIYISIDRVKDNAKTHNATMSNELKRVLIHGVLHLCGYKDKSAADSKLMRDKENYYLSLLK